MAQEPVRITVQGVLEDLQNGYTRTTSDKQYQGEGKSIEEKYGLNKTQVSQLFKHDKLKGRKTKVADTPAFILIDEDEVEGESTATDESSITSITSIEEASDNEDTAENEPEEEVTPSEETPSWM
jgi:hypothetical protein